MATLQSILDLGGLDRDDLAELAGEIRELLDSGLVPSARSLSPAAWVVRAKLISQGRLESTANRNRQCFDAYQQINQLRKAA